MRLVPLEVVKVVEGRYRKEFDEAKLLELADSIHRLGLQHPPVVRMTSDGIILVAGERRLRSMKLLYEKGLTVSYAGSVLSEGQVPVNLYNELDPTTAKEIELEENIKRHDLTWQEVAVATSELHELRSLANPEQTLSATAAELGEARGRVISPTQVSNRIILSQNLHRPSVAKATSEKEAFRALTREFEREFSSAMGKLQSTSTSKHLLQLVDALDGTRVLPDQAVDVVLTDPPYGVDADKFNVDSCREKHKYEDTEQYLFTLVGSIAPELMRVCRKQAHLFWFCDVQHFDALKLFFSNTGFDVWPRPIIWHKNAGHIPRPQHGPRRVYETILYALKGDRPIISLYDDVLTIPLETNRNHAAQKPVELYKALLSHSINPGDTVFDPFCGSGTIFPAAHALKCTAIGFDSDPAAIALSRERISKL